MVDQARGGDTDNITLSVPREHASMLLDHLRRDFQGMKGDDQVRNWLQTDLIRPLEQASQQRGTQSSTR